MTTPSRPRWSAFPAVLLLVTATASAAEAAEVPGCGEQSLVTFLSQGLPLTSQVIGADDACDGFGGNLIRTPENNLFLYVNFNIPGTIDVDRLDQAFIDCVTPETKDWLLALDIAVVTEKWMREVQGDDYDAVVNRWGDTLFISARLLREGRIDEFWKRFYCSVEVVAGGAAGWSLREKR